MKPFTIQQAAAVLDAPVYRVKNGALCPVDAAASERETARLLTSVSTDTRTLEPGALFVPLSGPRFNGHDYLAEAVRRGAAAVLAQETDAAVRAAVDIPVIAVPDTLLAYEHLAAWYRNTLDAQVIGVTGSVGKTGTRDMIHAAMGRALPVASTQANLNNQIGLSQTILSTAGDRAVLVTELGTDGPGQMAELSRIAQPDIAVITMIGLSHVEHFGSAAAIAAEKTAVADGLRPDGILLLNGDDPHLSGRAAGLAARHRVGLICVRETRPDPAAWPGVRSVYWASGVQEEAAGVAFDVTVCKPGAPDVCPGRVRLGVHGRHQVYNALFGLFCASLCGVAFEAAAQGLRDYRPTGNRQRVIECGVTLINDTYNASAESVRAGLALMAGLAGSARRKIVALAGINELGDFSEAVHRSVGADAAAVRPDRMYCLGPDAPAVADGFREAAARASDSAALCPPVVCPDRQTLIRQLLAEIRPGDVVYVKGSRAYRMELVCEAVQAAMERNGEREA